MSSGFYTWSQTAASNATADSSINWAEGQAPSSINDSARAMMAATAKYRDDIAGAIVTGGTATAYTVTSYQVFDTLAHLNGQMIAFAPNATSTNAVGVDVTLNVDGLGAKPVRMQPSVALPGGTLISGTPYIVVYNNSDGVFYLHNTINPYVIPLGAGMDFWGTTTPNSSFAFPTGQAISRTTYATLFSLLGTTYGTGDGSTTFNLPDKTGRVSAMKETSATRLTSTYFGGTSTTLGATGGQEGLLLPRTALPNVAPTFTGDNTTTFSLTTPIPKSTFVSGSGSVSTSLSEASNASGSDGNLTPAVTGSITPKGTVQSLNGGVTQTGTVTMGPTIICNYILRII